MVYNIKDDKLTQKMKAYFLKKESIHFVAGLVVGVFIGAMPEILIAVVIAIVLYFVIKWKKG